MHKGEPSMAPLCPANPCACPGILAGSCVLQRLLFYPRFFKNSAGKPWPILSLQYDIHIIIIYFHNVVKTKLGNTAPHNAKYSNDVMANVSQTIRIMAIIGASKASVAGCMQVIDPHML